MDEGADTKGPRRKRVSRACDRCRTKKDKCDGIRPTCSACQASGLTCSYDPNARKRGLPEGYVRGLEKLWALSICNIEGFEDTMLTMLGATERAKGRRERLMALWTDDGSSDSLHEAWKSSRVCAALEKMLSPGELEQTQSPAKRPREEEDDGAYYGALSRWGFRVGRGADAVGVEGPRVVDPISPSPMAKRQRLSSATESSLPIYPDKRNTVQSLQLPSHAPQLLETYFSKTHPWFPIIPKHNILRASYLYANGASHTGNQTTNSGDHAALWAILSYTTGQEYRNTQMNGTFIHDPLAQAREFYSVARSLIPSEKEKFDLGHIQALLLLSLVNVGLEDWTAAWLLCGQAARLAEAMKLAKHLDSRSDDARQRKAAFMGCFIIDSILSIRLSRSPCLRANDVVSSGRLEEDGLEEWNSWVDVLPSRAAFESINAPHRGPLLALSCFNRLFELTSVLNKIAWDFPQATNAQVFVQQILIDLTALDDRLPAGCHLIGPKSDHVENTSALLPHQSYLYIVYAATLLFLYVRQLNQGHFMQGNSQPIFEGIKKILYRTLDVLSQHMENFQVCGLPPLFEFPLRSIIESVTSVRSKLETAGFPVSKWMNMFAQKLTEFGLPWPVFKALGDSLSSLLYNASSTYPSKQQRPIGTSDIGDQYYTNDSKLVPSYSNMREPSQTSADSRHNPATNWGSSHIPIQGGIYNAPTDPLPATMDTASQDQRAADILGKLMGGEPPPSDPHLLNHRPHQLETPDSTSLQPTIPDSTERFPTAPRGFSVGQGRAYMTDEASSSPNDLDSIFKELAYLDTTDWANSREEGLREFGFVDDSTFQAFCHDPDRLVGSRPLVLPTAMSIADIWPPPGFFPETFQGNPKDGIAPE
ncbi:putative C6 transcription factor [Talaromyces proteolyticus]|uniref:C6 transcription factor n=1 Tax=Talaromyces proteolyticus TaxID=1131652 RepID=A0AAD4KFP1_9EURO|nr:putative C6 transcription factor [Talaromyces proteolyticus]KAH8689189.1 putative C6 transcription factor [Talaromyces proteolyticus]